MLRVPTRPVLAQPRAKEDGKDGHPQPPTALLCKQRSLSTRSLLSVGSGHRGASCRVRPRDGEEGQPRPHVRASAPTPGELGAAGPWGPSPSSRQRPPPPLDPGPG